MTLTPDTLRTIGEALYGDRWQTDLASAIGVNDRTMRRWASGDTPVPEGAASELREIVAVRRAALDELLERLP